MYRDDGLGVTKASPRQAELIKKELCSIFAKYGLKITIEANKKVVNFLDVTLNLANGKYLPYNKPGNIPLYVNKKSNHPPRIIENIPKSINKRLSEISLDEDSFSKAAPLYQKAVDDSGYNHRLSFSVPTHSLQPLEEETAIETSFGTTPLSAGTWLLTLDDPFLRSSTRNSRRATHCIKSSTGTLLRSVTAACRI